MKKVMFLVVAVLFMFGMNTAFAQNQDLIHYTIDVVTNPLAITVGEFTAAGLNANTCYQIPCDPLANGQLIVPYTGNESYEQVENTVVGDPGAFVDVMFTLPYTILGATYGAAVTCSYDHLCLAWGASGAENFFGNPEGTTTTMQLDINGEVYFMLSANVCTPNIPDADTFEADAVCTVQYH